ncbi:MAG: valine--tRNA ligase [Candidatus Melainabacteria bacterium RIFOXYA12_FULL_32_12]|nr:MAG: valine--tRNA ligase [Candidatus Melainabacteria bacterium RIFOXYA2_FULL_32_9]OGI30843.1 MAG: valine--tRNA ligase [Candidatus Melainabacteria bacterium RIFOXYA12_FULL_32_12]
MKELPTAYNPKETEEKIYKFWEENDCFKADVSNPNPAYSIVIPPPNVTGVLHMGHALDGTLQDILIRYHRMLGYAALWLPGTDHAGIATQNVVEKKLREEGLSRHDLGREKFLRVVWDWANDHKSRILGQFKRLGASFDLSRERFTLDEGCSKAVKEVFVDLYNKGLIYKGSYIVNWCPRCRSAISDIETEYVTEQGHLWEISYPLKDKYGAIVVATTRPETMFGDVAVAVNPNDLKYSDMIGQTVALPLTGREIPIIADEAVEIGFGTGALKITPAHDPNDYEIGKRHGLKPLWVMDIDGKLVDNELVPHELRGLDRYEARKKAVEMIEKHGLLVRVVPHEHNVGHCQRCGETVEPYLSEQWFVKMEPLAKRPIEAISTGELNFIPERWTKIYLDWMENIRDWCISRQLWWGHQIPAYYCDDCGEMIVATEKPEKCTKCPSSNITQDTDVLDTWFSSALWPFSTMGWPDTNAPDFNKFYPTSTLVTGFDIIFFWVARMVVMGYQFTDKSPFKNVYIHGLIRDEHGQKMSKSKGNTIDPVEIIDKYGSDALRFTLTSLVTYGGQDIKVSDDRFEYGRNFANKIWNASRFVLMNLQDMDDNLIDTSNLTIADRWILHRYNETVKEVNKNFADFRIGETAHVLYEFFWSTYCDWYLEIAKIQLQDESQRANTQRVLRFILERTLRLLHPVMPHITEEIWQLLPGKAYKDDSNTIMLTKYPQPDKELEDTTAENSMNIVIDTIRSLRNIRQTLNIPPSSRLNIQVYSEDSCEKEIFELSKPYVSLIARVDQMEVNLGMPKEIPAQSATAVVSTSRIIVPLAGLIDIDKETQRQKKKIEALEKEKKGLEARINNPRFVESAPETVVKQTNERINEINQQYQAVEELLKSLVG